MYFQDTKYKLILISLISVLLFPLPILLHAATFTVNNTADKVDASPGDGLCADNTGNCTLRAAIQEANSLVGADTINIPAGTYVLSVPGILENAADTGDLDITENLKIIGDSAATTTISANMIDRVFHIVGSIDVSISDVSIIEGKYDDNAWPDEKGGGGIFNRGGTVNLKDVIVRKNDGGGGGGGGGIENLDGTLNIENSDIIENPGFFAGGIGNSGTYNLTLVDSRISKNGDIGIVLHSQSNGTVTATNTEFSNGLGGIYCASCTGSMTVKNCTFNDNHGNPALQIVDGTITNSTFSNNDLALRAVDGGTTTVINSTFAGNSGGVNISSGEVRLSSSIVASNSIDDCSGKLVTSLGNNLDSDGSCNLNKPSDLPNTDPLLDKFTDDGTPGRGHFPLLEGSPAIDKGNDDACPLADQLGNPRVDGDGDGVITCDIGSIEYQGLPRVFTDVPSGYWAEEEIYKIYEAGITTGCSKDPLMFCPERTVNRSQMAVFLGRATHGSNFTPPAATGIFADVPKWYWAADWIEQFYADGLTKGCKIDPHDPQAAVMYYCPKYPVTRTTMAIFLLRAKHGANYQPPAATGIFEDVGVNSWAADWIEQLYREGITTGCKKEPLMYCPAKHVTRAQMAVFLTRILGLTLNDGLVASYPFNGNANDESGNGNHGTAQGATLAADRFGNVDSAYSFDGMNDKIEVLPNPTLNPGEDSFSYSFWMKTTTLQFGFAIGRYDNNGPFQCENTTWGIQFGESNKSWVYFRDENIRKSCDPKIVESAFLADGKFHFIAVVRDKSDGKIKYYVNSTILFKMDDFSDDIVVNSPLIMGTHGGFPQYFKGTIDDIRIYTRALSEAEINALYNFGN